MKSVELMLAKRACLCGFKLRKLMFVVKLWDKNSKKNFQLTASHFASISSTDFINNILFNTNFQLKIVTKLTDFPMVKQFFSIYSKYRNTDYTKYTASELTYCKL